MQRSVLLNPHDQFERRSVPFSDHERMPSPRLARGGLRGRLRFRRKHHSCGGERNQFLVSTVRWSANLPAMSGGEVHRDAMDRINLQIDCPTCGGTGLGIVLKRVTAPYRSGPSVIGSRSIRCAPDRMDSWDGRLRDPDCRGGNELRSPVPGASRARLRGPWIRLGRCRCLGPTRAAIEASGSVSRHGASRLRQHYPTNRTLGHRRPKPQGVFYMTAN
jgi:hypothetical protein